MGTQQSDQETYGNPKEGAQGVGEEAAQESQLQWLPISTEQSGISLEAREDPQYACDHVWTIYTHLVDGSQHNCCNAGRRSMPDR